MGFLSEDAPIRGVPIPAGPGLRRIVAPNPGPMTYHGTNTWLIDEAEGTVVLDPGPDDPSHVAAILAATGGRVSRILLSHTHRDHLGALAALRQATGAAACGFARSADPGFHPDIGLADGDDAGGFTALHTPGHAADHVCFAHERAGLGRVLFSGDHVMSWSSSVVSPPGGDMAAYCDSLRRLLGREDDLYLPGHGPPLPRPRQLVRALLTHRLAREAAIASALAEGPKATGAITAALYAKIDPALHRAAERNVLAHLLKLQAEGRAVNDGEVWRAV